MHLFTQKHLQDRIVPGDVFLCFFDEGRFYLVPSVVETVFAGKRAEEFVASSADVLSTFKAVDLLVAFVFHSTMVFGLNLALCPATSKKVGRAGTIILESPGA